MLCAFTLKLWDAKMSRKPKQKSTTPPAKLSEPLQNCWSLLKHFQEKPENEAFLTPVDWEAFGLHDYPDVIKNPMDLGTIQEKLENGKYSSVQQFDQDFRLVWTNCMNYNQPGSDLYNCAEKNLKSYEKRILKLKQSAKKSGGTSKGEIQVSRDDRLKLARLVDQLSTEQLGQLVEIIQKECPEALTEEDNGDELEIEINNIDPSTLLQLNSFAESCTSGSKIKKQKV